MPYYPYQNPYQNPYQYTPQNSILWVSGEREAMAYPVAPNAAVALWSQSEPVVYLKQSDASGRPTIKVYDLTERSGGENNQEFATKSDFSGVMSALESIRADIESMKGDVYGIAGKRRVKKPIEEDEE